MVEMQRWGAQGRAGRPHGLQDQRLEGDGVRWVGGAWAVQPPPSCPPPPRCAAAHPQDVSFNSKRFHNLC